MKSLNEWMLDLNLGLTIIKHHQKNFQEQLF